MGRGPDAGAVDDVPVFVDASVFVAVDSALEDDSPLAVEVEVDESADEAGEDEADVGVEVPRASLPECVT